RRKRGAPEASEPNSRTTRTATDGEERNGKSTAGQQRKHSTHSRKTRQQQYPNTATQPGTHQKNNEKAKKGVGSRATARNK
ncbi:IS1-like element transposase, partial [Shigella sonnei]|nr:IS1-like element transposase [Shigella sonnei]